MTYNPTRSSEITTLEELRRYVEDEFERLSKSLNETTALELRPVFREPDSPREGMIVFADGTGWNPGGGKGVYTYSGGAWVKL